MPRTARLLYDRTVRFGIILRFAPALLGACATSASPGPANESAPLEASELAARIAQFAPAELTADLTLLPASERAALGKIIEAAKLLDPVFDRQAWARNPSRRAALEKAAQADRLAALQLEYFDIMRGPWDRQDHFAPFAVRHARPKGAGFYPEDLTKEEFRAFVAAHPEEKAALESLFTLVRRTPSGLVAVPYREAFSEWLEPAADRLRQAAELTTNESLKNFLRLRADAFLSDDYYASDKAWMDVESLVEVTIGPYETYEDELLGLKASFEAFVTVNDPEASKRLARYKSLLPEMENNLPIPDEVKTQRGAQSPIRVVDLVYTSGDARKSVQTIAFNLPNDERVRKEKGAKKVLLRNIIREKFERILRPIAGRILAEDQQSFLSSEAFFNEVLFHELSHSLGPAMAHRNGERIEIRKALGASASPLEEAKADVMGAYNVLYMIDKGLFEADFRPSLLISYFVGLFRSVRFGVAEAHGKGAALQINRFLEEGAATFDAQSGRYRVDLQKLEASITRLVRDICLLQHTADLPAVEALLARYGRLSESMNTALRQLGRIPVDLRPIYPAAEAVSATR